MEVLIDFPCREKLTYTEHKAHLHFIRSGLEYCGLEVIRIATGQTMTGPICLQVPDDSELESIIKALGSFMDLLVRHIGADMDLFVIIREPEFNCTIQGSIEGTRIFECSHGLYMELDWRYW